VRQKIWEAAQRPREPGPVYIDIDASWSRSTRRTSSRQRPPYKGGFGFHPMFCFADATGEALSGLLRPGNAGSNTVTDHVCVLDAALDQLPEPVRAGTSRGRRSEPRGASGRLPDRLGRLRPWVRGGACERATSAFFTVAATNSQIQAAIFDAEGVEGVWETRPGPRRRGA